jgi:hypothetical protein
LLRLAAKVPLRFQFDPKLVELDAGAVGGTGQQLYLPREKRPGATKGGRWCEKWRGAGREVV